MLRRRWIPRASTRARGATWGCPRGERAGWRPGRFDSVTGAGRLPALRQGRPGHRRQERSVRRYVPMCGGRGLCEAGGVRLGGTGGPDSRFLAMAFSRTKKSWLAWARASRRQREVGVCGRDGGRLVLCDRRPPGAHACTEIQQGEVEVNAARRRRRRQLPAGSARGHPAAAHRGLGHLPQHGKGAHTQLGSVAKAPGVGSTPQRQGAAFARKGTHWRPSRPRSAGRRCPKAFAGRRGPAARTSAQKRQTRRQRRQKRAGGRRPTIPSAL